MRIQQFSDLFTRKCSIQKLINLWKLIGKQKTLKSFQNSSVYQLNRNLLILNFQKKIKCCVDQTKVIVIQ